jgi:RNA polymerase sigma factor (TIGR02999 family)
MSDVTRVLSAVERGDPHAAEELLGLVYDELRRLAAQRLAQEEPGQTLEATALVHEAYVRLVEGAPAQRWQSRGHFFGAAAEAMRRILIERARRQRRLRHGGGRKRIDVDHLEPAQQQAAGAPAADLLALDEALGRLAADEPVAAEVVKLRYFAGLTAAQAADALGISLRTANRHWAYAKAWLYQRLKCDDS